MQENSAKNAVYPRPFRSDAAAEWLGISKRHLGELTRQGLIPAKKFGGIWFYSQQELAKFVGVADDEK